MKIEANRVNVISRLSMTSVGWMGLSNPFGNGSVEKLHSYTMGVWRNYTVTHRKVNLRDRFR